MMGWWSRSKWLWWWWLWLWSLLINLASHVFFEHVVTMEILKYWIDTKQHDNFATSCDKYTFSQLNHFASHPTCSVSSSIQRDSLCSCSSTRWSTQIGLGNFLGIASSTSAELKQQPHQVFLSLILILPQEMTAKTILWSFLATIVSLEVSTRHLALILRHLTFFFFSMLTVRAKRGEKKSVAF